MQRNKQGAMERKTQKKMQRKSKDRNLIKNGKPQRGFYTMGASSYE